MWYILSLSVKIDKNLYPCTLEKKTQKNCDVFYLFFYIKFSATLYSFILF